MTPRALLALATLVGAAASAAIARGPSHPPVALVAPPDELAPGAPQPVALAAPSALDRPASTTVAGPVAGSFAPSAGGQASGGAVPVHYRVSNVGGRALDLDPSTGWSGVQLPEVYWQSIDAAGVVCVGPVFDVDYTPERFEWPAGASIEGEAMLPPSCFHAYDPAVGPQRYRVVVAWTITHQYVVGRARQCVEPDAFADVGTDAPPRPPPVNTCPRIVSSFTVTVGPSPP